jgi:uncharacterized membrane protein YhaH (DUF805 family)
MDLKKMYLSFEGRINRKIYWLNYTIPFWVIYFVAITIDGETNFGFFSLIVVLIMFWPALAMGVKRCHDRNRTGWFLLLGMVPILNFWVIIELLFLKGTEGNNKYGEDLLQQLSPAPESQPVQATQPPE